MTTKVVNIEDTQPYVAPPVDVQVQAFRDSIAFSAEMAEEEIDYFRKAKSWSKANVQKDLFTVLKDVAKADDPEAKLEAILDRMRRTYMELVSAQVEARDAAAILAVKEARKPFPKSVPDPKPGKAVSKVRF
jgi:hypothetical protein